MNRSTRAVVAVFLAAITACTSHPDSTITTRGPTMSTPANSETGVSTSTTTLDNQPEDRWIRVDGDRFMDTRTDSEFVPRGVNLLLKVGGGGGDRMFARYDPDWVDAQLDAIASGGFNTVRFFLDMCMSCTSDSDGIRTDYLDDLADLLTRLEAHGLVALPTSNDVPDPGYSERLPCCEPFGGYRNSLYLSSEGHAIATEYWTDLLDGLAERGAPTHHVLGWELANEQFVLRGVPPISSTEGSVTTADGNTYDLAEDADVEQMVISNLRAYVTTVGSAIREEDPGAFVTMGFFGPEEFGAGRVAADERWVVPNQMLVESTLDFIDLHAYPGLGATWDSVATSFGLIGESSGRPLVLGEFGAFEDAYPDPEEAAAAMARWQAESCEWGFGGWLLWFWGAERDDEVITADAHDAEIARAVSPSVRPDPCDVGEFASDDLALGRPATASATESNEYRASNVTDGSDATWWSAADGPPQWVEVDLEAPQTVDRVEILIGHVSAPGPQTHRVYVRGGDAEAPGTLVGEVSADAHHGDWLVVGFDPVSDVRYVRVETVAVDGWVILHEVRILG